MSESALDALILSLAVFINITSILSRSRRGPTSRQPSSPFWHGKLEKKSATTFAGTTEMMTMMMMMT